MEAAVRIHALQLAERWLATPNGTGLLNATLAAFAVERNPRVQIQFALSLGESRDTRAFRALAQLVRERSDVRWMDAAVLSGLNGRATEMLSELLREPGNSTAFLPLLAQSIAARRDEAELARTLNLLTYATPGSQAAILSGLAKGRKTAERKPISDRSARAVLAGFVTNSSTEVSRSARALADTFSVPSAIDDVPSPPSTTVEQVTDETFRRFLAALAGPRDLKRGHELYVQACATCHRIGGEGHDVGPDLLGQLGMAEETLLHDVLTPNERIRPGYETMEARTRDGGTWTGLLKDDGATSITLVQAGGVEQVLLRKDVSDVRRLTTSLMPSFAEGISPSDMANILAWLRGNLNNPKEPAKRQ
jgi:putative heme-binding domain-containing protein